MSIQEYATRSVRQRAEGFVSYGAPTCDVCRDTPKEKRHDDAEFWPDDAIHYLNGPASPAVEFWAATLGPHHDTDENRPDEATHRAVNHPEYIGDEHRMNSAYEHIITEIEEL
jgi:hypothetical protein